MWWHDMNTEVTVATYHGVMETPDALLAYVVHLAGRTVGASHSLLPALSSHPAVIQIPRFAGTRRGTAAMVPHPVGSEEPGWCS